MEKIVIFHLKKEFQKFDAYSCAATQMLFGMIVQLFQRHGKEFFFSKNVVFDYLRTFKKRLKATFKKKILHFLVPSSTLE